MNSSIINQNIVHLKVRINTIILVLKLDEGVLKRIACFLISDHLTA